MAGLEYAAGVDAEVVGKPTRAYFEVALADLGASPAESVMVGDDVDAGIGGAKAAGLRALLVRTGKFREETLAGADRPDGVVGSIAEVPAFLRRGGRVKVGLDLITEIQRIHDALERYPRFRERCFTTAEREYCDSRANPAQHYAARFAGKEAVGKALGFGVARAFAWKEVEIAGPKPSVRLSGRLEAWSERVGAGDIDLSMTHSKGMAAAVAVVAPPE